MVGTSRGSAPRSRSRAESRPACSRARGTSTVLPNRERFSYQAMRPRSPATSPITTTAGELTLACSAAAAMPARDAETTRCAGVVPCSITAAGVAGSRPASISREAMAPSRSTPMSTQIVPISASAAQRAVVAPFAGSSWPVTTAKALDRSRWVSGMPA